MLYAEYRFRGRVLEVDDEADGPVLLYVWRWFNELAATRGAGTPPLRYREIDAWARLLRIRPRPFEIRLIMQIDALWRLIAEGRDVREIGKGDDGLKTLSGMATKVSAKNG